MSTGGNDVNAGVDENNMEGAMPDSKGGSVNDDLDNLIDQELNWLRLDSYLALILIFKKPVPYIY